MLVSALLIKINHNYLSVFCSFLYALYLINAREMEHIKTDKLSKKRIILFY